MGTTLAATPATVAELKQARGKAEIVNGKVVMSMPTGDQPSRAAFQIAVSLHLYALTAGLPGIAVGDNAGFLCHLPHRQSFSPDAAFYTGPRAGMNFFPEPPVFAVEVRSDGDYGPAAEREMTAKRQDYFAAGTQVVWDVDLLAEAVIRKFTAAGGPEHPVATFSRQQLADANPAVPGWTMDPRLLFE